MDNVNQTGSNPPSSGDVDISKVEITPDTIPVSSLPQKEIEPVKLTEHIRPSEPELNIHPEIAGMMEKTAEHPALTQEHHDAGIWRSEPELVIAVESKPQATESLPMTEIQAIHTAKIGNPNSTKRWFANLVLKVIEKVKKQNELSPRSV